MKLRDAIAHYIVVRRSRGARFHTGAQLLRQFCRQLNAEIHCDSVTTRDVLEYISGNGVLTATRSHKYSALRGFFRYAISRGYVARSPLPASDEEPRQPAAALPHVFTSDELHQLFQTIEVSRKKALKLNAYIFRTLLLLLHATGLRISEALHLTLNDVDLADAVLTVRNSKFNKSRLVPIGAELTEALQSYQRQRMRWPLLKAGRSAFVAYQDGTPLTYKAVHKAFAKLLQDAGVQSRADKVCQNPCLHSLRHGFATGRITDWYQQGADVQRLLPILSTHLGHSSIDATQVYLSMTPELLHEASVRFDQYLKGVSHE